MSIPLYMAGTIVCANTSSPTQQELEDCPQIILTYQNDWDPHSVLFPKVSQREEKEYLFAGIAEICVDALKSKVHETNIEPGLRNIVNDPSFIAMRLVSQVGIDGAKVPDASGINGPDEDVFEG